MQMSVEEFEAILAQQFTKEFVLWDRAIHAENTLENNVVNDLGHISAELLLTEDNLNKTKNKVKRIVTRRCGKEMNKWRSHTKFTHTLKDLPKRILEELQTIESTAESTSLWDSLYTQAYCKLMELLIAYPNLIMMSQNKSDQIRTLHLCEAPGGFICAIRDYLYGNSNLETKGMTAWRWWINSLSKDVCSGFLLDKYIGRQENLALGPAGDGDIFKWDDKYIDEFIEKCGGKFAFITADGSFDCTENPQAQEKSVRDLIAKEVEIALRCVAVNGNFVIKIFTFFTFETIERVLLPLITNFERVVCRKPASSKPGNSEIYLICFTRVQNLNNASSCTASINSLKVFERISQCAQFFAQHQQNYVEFNLRTFCNLSQSQRAAINIRKCAVVEYMTTEIVKKIRNGVITS